MRIPSFALLVFGVQVLDRALVGVLTNLGFLENL
jgi:hypothetical protein